MLLVAKTSLISRCMGFVRDGGALGDWKKRGFSPPPPTSPYIKQKDLIRRGSSQPPSLKSLAAPPPPPPPTLPPDCLGNVFAFPIPWLVSDFTQFKLNVHYLFTYAVTLVAGLYGMFPEYPTLFYTEGLLFRIPRLFLIGSNLWYPIYFSPHNGGHSCTCSKLPRSSFELRQHYSYNGFNHTDFSRKRQKGAFFKIPSQLQTNISFTNLL